MARSDKTNTTKSPKPTKANSQKAKPTDFKKLITWFEIPAFDFSRAVSFYGYLYGFEMETSKIDSYSMAFFPSLKGINGAIVCGEGSIPSDKGPLIYLNAVHGLDAMLARVEEAGGRVLLGKTLINEDTGSFALFLDSEGNKLALHEK